MQIVAIVALAMLLAVALPLAAIHWGFSAPRLIERGTPGDLGLAFEQVELRSARGKRLHGWLLPGEAAAGAVVLMHGWGGNAEMMLPLALPLKRAGLQVLLLDARNHGLSEADSFSSMPRFAEDVEAAADWLERRPGGPPSAVALIGHSVGGGAVLLAASRRRDIAAVISIGAFAHPDWLMRRQLTRFHIPRPLTGLILRYVEWVIGHAYDDIAPINTLCRVACPVLLVHGLQDTVIPVSDLEAIKRNCGGDHTQVLLVEGAGHQSIEAIERHGPDLVAFLGRAGVRGRAQNAHGAPAGRAAPSQA